jgi:bacteriorhodopsin
MNKELHVLSLWLQFAGVAARLTMLLPIMHSSTQQQQTRPSPALHIAVFRISVYVPMQLAWFQQQQRHYQKCLTWSAVR